jgi:hypothetical protein
MFTGETLSAAAPGEGVGQIVVIGISPQDAVLMAAACLGRCEHRHHAQQKHRAQCQAQKSNDHAVFLHNFSSYGAKHLFSISNFAKMMMLVLTILLFLLQESLPL